MADVSVRTVSVSPTGACVFQARMRGKSDTHFYWNGEGSILYIMVGQTRAAITHSSAVGSFKTRREAMEAIHHFMRRA